MGSQSSIVGRQSSDNRRWPLVVGLWPKPWLAPVIRDLSYNGLANDQ